MATGTQLLDRVAKSVKEEQEFILLGRIIEPLRCARFPPKVTVPVGRLRESPEHYRVLQAADLKSYHYHRREQWALYEDISAAFAKADGSSHITKLPRPLVDAPVKLVAADRSANLRWSVTAEAIYPRRAWIGALAPGWELAMAFAVVGILNSAIGHVLYARTAQEVGSQSKELAKKVLERLPIAAPALKPSTFAQVALLSYRLHQLYEAQSACRLDLPSYIRDHQLYLLSAVVELYGWSEKEARELIKEAPHTRDHPGSQEELFAGWPRTPLLPVRLLDDRKLEQYETLKGATRSGSITPKGADELSRLQDALYWEHRINQGIPSRLIADPWPGVTNEQQAVRAACAYLSHTRGQRFGVELPARRTERLWEIAFFYSPPRGLSREDAARLPEGWAEPGKHPAGKLYVDAITGVVSESQEGPQHAVAAQSR